MHIFGQKKLKVSYVPKVVNDIQKFGLSLETFANLLVVSVSVAKNLVSEKSLGIVTENLVLEEKSW